MLLSVIFAPLVLLLGLTNRVICPSMHAAQEIQSADEEDLDLEAFFISCLSEDTLEYGFGPYGPSNPNTKSQNLIVMDNEKLQPHAKGLKKDVEIAQKSLDVLEAVSPDEFMYDLSMRWSVTRKKDLDELKDLLKEYENERLNRISKLNFYHLGEKRLDELQKDEELSGANQRFP